MAYHLIPFVAGAVIGGLAVYLFRNEKVRGELRQSASSISRKVQQTAGEVSGKVSKGLSQTRDSMPGRGARTEPPTAPVDDAGSADLNDPSEVTGTPKPVRRTSPRKKAARKVPAQPPKTDAG